MSSLRIAAIIPAAGIGKRLNCRIRKPYVALLGKPILFYTLSVFEKAKFIDEIICAVRGEDLDYCAENIIKKFDFKKTKLVSGGKTRFHSVKNSLEAISDKTEIVVIHDAVRPFLKEDLLKKAIFAANRFGSSCVAVPLKDTVKKVDKNLNIIKTPLREMLWRAQTPQCFRYSIIKEAYEKAERKKILFKDDASVVESINKKVKIIKGSYENIKITTTDDILVAEAILKKNF